MTLISHTWSKVNFTYSLTPNIKKEDMITILFYTTYYYVHKFSTDAH